MDERWVKVTPEQRWATENAAEFFDADDEHEMSDQRAVHALVATYDAAEGQRVEEIRWCETHAMPANDDFCFLGRKPHACRIVDATLILPPRVEP
jgi:hypothetical protein